MRVINTTTLEFQEFYRLPEFAILSHTWEQDEVSYQEMARSPITPETKAKQGFLKIKAFADLARADGWDWIWVDTCCIDKTSSADLSESINSMYKWYRSAGICYVYLSDLPGPQASSFESLSRCGWFTRGWTLQELIAPPNVIFYSQAWEFCFSKADKCQELSRITGIDQRVLRGQIPPSACSMAQRMSWASKRHTTRPEDMAYCLLGIFGINMPMLYGEGGQKAFIRLQQEILKGPFDESLFAWTSQHNKPFTYRGLLARHPREFEFTGHLRPWRDGDFLSLGARLCKISASNLGFKVGFDRYMSTKQDSVDGSHKTGLAVLQCLDAGVDGSLMDRSDYVCIMIKLVRSEPETYIRLDADRLYSWDEYRRLQSSDPVHNHLKFYMPIDTVGHIQLSKGHTMNKLAGFFLVETFDVPWTTVAHGCSDCSLEWDPYENGWLVPSDTVLDTGPSTEVTHMAVLYNHDSIKSQGLAIMIIISWDRACCWLEKPGFLTDIVLVRHDTVISEYLREYNFSERINIRHSGNRWDLMDRFRTANLSVLVEKRIFGIEEIGAAVEIDGRGDWNAIMEGIVDRIFPRAGA